MIIKLLVALGPVGAILLVSELLWRKKIIKGERARKFIHVLAGVWMAFWPFYIPFDGIFILAAATLVLALYSRFTHLFHAIYTVKRKTYGDIIYPIGILVCAYFGQEPWIFTVSILLLALADGGAAVVGRLWGERSEYFVFGLPYLKKSLLGTAAFFILAVVSVLTGWFVGGSDVLQNNLLFAFIVLPLTATLLENSIPFGFDNITTPLLATLLLNSLL